MTRRPLTSPHQCLYLAEITLLLGTYTCLVLLSFQCLERSKHTSTSRYLAYGTPAVDPVKVIPQVLPHLLLAPSNPDSSCRLGKQIWPKSTPFWAVSTKCHIPQAKRWPNLLNIRMSRPRRFVYSDPHPPAYISHPVTSRRKYGFVVVSDLYFILFQKHSVDSGISSSLNDSVLTVLYNTVYIL